MDQSVSNPVRHEVVLPQVDCLNLIATSYFRVTEASFGDCFRRALVVAKIKGWSLPSRQEARAFLEGFARGHGFGSRQAYREALVRS